MKVLVVEDNPDTLDLLRKLLEGKGCHVVCVTDGAEALAAVAFSLKTDPFDLAIVDIAMRHVDGLAFFRALKCFEANELYGRPVRVKFYTAHTEFNDLVNKGKLPREDYYVKGSDTLRLHRDLEELVSCGESKSS